MKELDGKKIAILVADGFEQSEMVEPRKALDKAGAKTVLISPNEEQVRGWTEGNWGKSFDVDLPLSAARPEDFDGLLLPGGVKNPDTLRMDSDAVEFVKEFFNSGKPVAAICHGPWTLINAGVVSGKKMTSYPSVSMDLKNAGADWVDEEVVVDHGLVTSRKPSDIPAFSKKFIEELREGRHDRKKSSLYSKRQMTGSGVD
ncbi:MAG: type 1 glutamine amidotransferase domain-containing protein [Verrucomicrobiota bacterium]